MLLSMITFRMGISELRFIRAVTEEMPINHLNKNFITRQRVCDKIWDLDKEFFRWQIADKEHA